MADKFTQKAQNTLTRAHSEARVLGHTYIGSEHILLALIEEKGSIASRMLLARGALPERIRQTVIELSGCGTKSQVRASDMTPRTKKIIEGSASEALKNGNGYIGTEHILSSLLSEEDCVAVKILDDSGISVSELKNDLSAYFSLGESRSRSSERTKRGNEPKIAGAPTLSNYGKDITELALKGNTDPVIGRDKETDRVIQILSRRTKNNPCLIGEPGVGKTAVVEGIAQRISAGNIPDSLKGRRLVTLDVASMIAGAKYRGEFEERMKNVMEEVLKNRDIILFIDELHMIMGAGAAEGAVDAANILKPALARGEIQIIGATTVSEYKAHIERDAALERRFQAVNVGEPSEEECIEIISGLRQKYEEHHGVKISDGAISAAVKLSVRYIPDRFLPDKAIDLIDEAASKLKIGSVANLSERKKLKRRLDDIEIQKNKAISLQDFELAASLREDELELIQRYDDLSDQEENEAAEIAEVSEGDIADVVTSWTSIPVSKLMQGEEERLSGLESELGERLKGQGEAIRAISAAVRRGRVGLKDPERPIGSFIFLGRTGVGKTELAKALAKSLFGSESAMIRLDMSEYMEPHSISKLIGSPPGYVGYREGGYLTEKIRRRPYSLLLLDEIEKAHPDVYNILLQVLDDGFLTDSEGRRVDFRNTVIIMTSNIGASDSERAHSLGFLERQNGSDEEKKRMLTALKSEFKPEFLNRIDEIIVFNTLTLEDIEAIAWRLLGELSNRASSLGFDLIFEKSAAEHIAKVSLDSAYGARPLRRNITNMIENFISEELIRGKIKKGTRIFVRANEGELAFEYE